MEQFAEKLIHGRTHVSPKRIGLPGPSPDQLEKILLSASSAPDHGRLLPWRFIEIQESSRDNLGKVFSLCLQDRDPKASALQLQEAYDKAFRGPLLLLAIASFANASSDISKEEQLISLGCAIQNILLISYSMGFGSGLSSGRALQSNRVRELFKIRTEEESICFITIGTVIKHKADRLRPAPSEYHSVF